MSETKWTEKQGREVIEQWRRSAFDGSERRGAVIKSTVHRRLRDLRAPAAMWGTLPPEVEPLPTAAE